MAGVAMVAVAAGSAISQADSARRARNQAQDAANTADPARALRSQFGDWVTNNWPSMSQVDFASLMQNPEIQFLRGEGQRGVINRNAAEFGSTRNGTFGEDMSMFNQSFASNYIDRAFARQMQVLGMAGGFSGLSSGNLGAAAAALNSGNQFAAGAMNNAWGQAGGAFQLWQNQQNQPTPMSNFTYQGQPWGGTASDPWYG